MQNLTSGSLDLINTEGLVLEDLMARSAAFAMTCLHEDLLLACSLANATCAIINIMTILIFIIVSWSHAFFLLVVVHSSLAPRACGSCGKLLFPKAYITAGSACVAGQHERSGKLYSSSVKLLCYLFYRFLILFNNYFTTSAPHTTGTCGLITK